LVVEAVIGFPGAGKTRKFPAAQSFRPELMGDSCAGFGRPFFWPPFIILRQGCLGQVELAETKPQDRTTDEITLSQVEQIWL